MKNQIQARKQGKSSPQSQQTKKFEAATVYALSLTRRVNWLPVLKKQHSRVCRVAAMLETTDISEIIYTAIACWISFGETRLHLAKGFPGDLCSQNYLFIIAEVLEEMSFADLEARFDALAARIEHPIDLVLSNTIKGFLDFAEVNQESAKNGIWDVFYGMDKERGKNKTIINVPFTAPELEAIDRACKQLGISRDQFFICAVTDYIESEVAV